MRILGLDGLDMELAEKWGFYHLLGSQHGKLEVPISKRYDHPHSPDVWASFLTGVWHDNLRFTRPYGLHRFLDLMLWLRSKIGTSLGLGKIGKRIYANTINQFPPLKHPVFNMDMYNVPYVNYDGAGLQVINSFTHHDADTWHTRMMLRILLSDRLTWVRYFFLGEGFAFLGFPDLIQHFTQNVDDIKDIYRVLDAYVMNIDDLLIIADHGFDLEKGLHSDVGYWSSNFDLGFMPEKITDFHSHLTSKKIEIIP